MMLDQPPRPDPPSAEPIERHPPSTAHSRINDSSPPSKAPSTKDLYVDQDARPVSSVLASLRIGATPQTFLTRTQSALPSLPVSPQSDEGVPQTPLQQQKGYAQPQQKSVFMKTPSMVAEPRHLLRPPPSPTVMENRKTKTLDPLPGRRMMSVLDFNRMVQTPRAGESRSLPPLSRLSTRPRPPPEWVRESRMSLLPPTPPPPPTHPPGEPLLKKTPVIGKIPKGLSSAEGYFRVFTEMKTVETVDVAKNGHHLATLLPHRYTKKMPLYGTSPRMMMMMQQRPPSRLAKLVATPTLRQSITMSRRPSMAPAATKRAARRLPKLANNAEPDATVAATETTVTAVEERPSAKTKRAPRKRINKAKLGAVKTPMPQKDGLAEREGNAAAMKTSGDAEGLEGLMEGKKNEESVAAASIEERTDPTDPTPWSQSPSQPIEPLTPPQHASLLPPPAAPLSSPTTTTTTLSQPPPTADYVPYKPRRPTPPNHVATDLSLLNRTEDSAEGEREDASDTLGGLPGQQPAAPATPTQKSKFAGRNHHASNAGFNPEEDVKKRRASFVPGLKKHGQAPKKMDMDSLRKRRQSNAAPHRAGLEGESAKEDFLSSLVKDMNVMDEDSKQRYIRVSEPLFKDNDLISIEDLGAELTRMKWITAGEVDYITKVFELVAGDYVDQSEFCVIAALAERMTFLDTSLRQSFGDTDFRKLEKNIKQYRHLFTVNTNEDGKMTYEDLKILLLSTGLPANSIEGVAALLNLAPAGKDPTKQSEVGFIDFLSYVPFFALLHDRIVDDPLGYNAGDENAAGGEDVVKKLMADLKARSESGAG